MMKTSYSCLFVALIAVVVALLLCRCATAPLASAPSTPIVHSTVADGGHYFNDANKAIIVGEGIPVAWFANKQGRVANSPWFLTSQQVDLAENICAHHRNPGVAPAQ